MFVLHIRFMFFDSRLTNQAFVSIIIIKRFSLKVNAKSVSFFIHLSPLRARKVIALSQGFSGKETYNKIENAKTFDIRALSTAYHFPFKPSFEPCFEVYDFSQIIFVTSGTAIYTTEVAEYEVRPGMMFYRPAGKRSMYRWETEQASFALISFVCPSEAMKTFEGKPFLLCEEERATLLDLMRTAARICEPVKRTEGIRGMRLRSDVPSVVLNFVYASLERFLIMVYCRLHRIELLVDESQKVNRHMDDVGLINDLKRYLSENLSLSLTVASIAEHFLISQTALKQKFRKETGQGVMEYFTFLKIQKAKQMISSSSKSFTEISEELGFSSVNYFSKVFKKEVGMTPTEYSKYASKRRLLAEVEDA